MAILTTMSAHRPLHILQLHPLKNLCNAIAARIRRNDRIRWSYLIELSESGSLDG